ncbi:protein of unknown function [Natronincola peptidivorans]|uniref:G5 domain-containing protein n=1 Tax=Natronincola peptidivorans TaxID=426128 RepID=A0A1I0CU17_9FIRM|nr:3D domain-containing protein [Natronincola peptidivorans]SET23269.1 protein of unknown function [Natronincola peptidivorans]
MDSFFSSKGFLKGASKKSLIAIFLVAIFAVGVSGMAMRKDVVLVYDGNEVKVSTFAGTVEALLIKEGIEIEEEDRVTPEPQERLQDGTRVIVHRAFEIKLVDGEEEEIIKTAERKVEDLLNILEIKLGEEDKIEPHLQAAIHPGEVVKIVRVTKEVVTEDQEIPFQTTMKYNDDMDYGKINRLQEGRTGFKEIELQVTYENGVEVAREVIGEKIIQEATNEIVEKGTARMLLTSRGDTRRYKDVVVMEASAYTAGYESTGKKPGDPFYGITRSGTQVRPGVVAVDPRVIPLGTKLYIESMDRTASYGMASAEDTGGSIIGNKIDLYFEDRDAALRFGRRNVKVYILE